MRGLHKKLDHRDGESRRLPRSSLGDSKEVLSLENDGDRLFLDRSRRCVPFFCEGLEYRFYQIEIGEGHSY